MREIIPFICEICREDTLVLRIIRVESVHLDICPYCHERIKTEYSQLEVVGHENN